MKELEYKLSAYKGNGELDSLQENLREKGLSQNPFTVYLRPALKSILEDPDKRALLDGQCIETLEELYSRPRFTIQETLIKLAVIQKNPASPMTGPRNAEIKQLDPRLIVTVQSVR
ncbi:hypothetical protein [Nitrospira sp. Nam74]